MGEDIFLWIADHALELVLAQWIFWGIYIIGRALC
jgi:hypothetical protein